ncbi:FHA domain-containing protein [Saccharothrix texasensis]|uniref:PSer/pThr/pTyr-binding forkhead associated (FHA) protein n=1 Tax=Saccharothrix texasensis TaxID=103734 RepID=A0A3N1GZI7_9PSEU|nr:FHA domain-containing protein [Saccharothrix texasensis]ROP35392.1 pSer/pThr/pTyr-binding forkhead associated (FHA) protein [Saccharothrix texasensis]
MATCPTGHDSATDDYCDVCGTPMPSGAGPSSPSSPSSSSSPAVVVEETCAACGAVRVGRFCEECGQDSSGPVTSRPVVARPVSWHVAVEADRAYFERVVAAGGPDAGVVAFPRFCPPRRFGLSGPQVSIGRRSRSRGIFPGIDLVGPPEDPGVSHHHAVLVASGDGWAVVDLGSTNGTTVNGAGTPLPPHEPHPLEPGDRVHVGAWTTLTLHRWIGGQT